MWPEGSFWDVRELVCAPDQDLPALISGEFGHASQSDSWVPVIFS